MIADGAITGLPRSGGPYRSASIGCTPMELRTLGANGPEISVVGFGGWQAGQRNWGETRPPEHAVEAIRAGIDAGMNWVDTAEVYGDGTSERLVGEAIAGIRDRLLVFTKV